MKRAFARKNYKTISSLMNEFIQLRREGGWIFRGVSRENEILPNISRVYDPIEKNNKNLFKYEYDLLYKFYKEGRHYFNGSFELLDYVAFAQHYGVPTRFIDWTKDPFVALYFSIVNNSSPENGVYRIYYTNIENHLTIENVYQAKPLVMGKGMELNNFIIDLKDFNKSIKDKVEFLNQTNDYHKFLQQLDIRSDNKYIQPINNNFLIFYNPPYLNDRLKAQEGLFSIPTDIDYNSKIMDEICRGTDYIELELSDSEREKGINYLRNLGYTEDKLFPEPASLGSYLKKEAIKRFKTDEENKNNRLKKEDNHL